MKTMGDSLLSLAHRHKCVFYNDLSHMNPIYASPGNVVSIVKEDEIIFHRRNIFLLALYFEHIIICTDNILAFSKNTQADIISSIVRSDWFLRMIESGIIILCGWGASRNADMIQNQIDYSNIYRPDLKKRDYVELLKSISSGSRIYVREYNDGEVGHVNYLLPRFESLRDTYSASDYAAIEEKIQRTQSDVGYVGSMEIFPEIESRLSSKGNLDFVFYHEYYRSWQEYSSENYYPIITVDSARSKIPGRIVFSGEIENREPVLSALYSPDFFLRYLNKRFGQIVDVKSQILGLGPDDLIRIRNGDWKVFLKEYHRGILAASSLSWVQRASVSTDFLVADELDRLIENELAKLLAKGIDVDLLAEALGGLVSLYAAPGPLVPALKIIRKKIGFLLDKSRNVVLFGKRRPTDGFLHKLRCALKSSRFAPAY